MIMFLLGLLTGVCGTVAFACLVAASRADDIIERS